MTKIKTRCLQCQGLNQIPTTRINEAAMCGACKTPLLDGLPIDGSSDNLQALIEHCELPIVIDFWAPWCGPCVNFAPVFKEVALQYQGIARFVKLDTEANPSISMQYRIRSIPTLMVFKHGKMIDMLSGALPKQEFEMWLNQALQK